MRVVNAALLGALVVVLSFIAYDLHRLTAFYVGVPTAIANSILSNTSSGKTFEQRVHQKMHDDADIDAELKVWREAQRRENAKSRR